MNSNPLTQAPPSPPPALLLLLIATTVLLSGCLEPTAEHPPLPPIETPENVTPEATPEVDRVAIKPGLKFITAGGFHTCAAKNANSSLYCWGEGIRGQASSGLSNIGTPTRTGSDQDWVIVSAGRQHTCGIRAIEQTEVLTNEAGEEERVVVGTLDTLWCWGDNQFGQSGTIDKIVDDKPDRLIIGNPTAVDIPIEGWTQISAGGYHNCAIHESEETGDRTLYCWGGNRHHQTGDATTQLIIFTPRQVDANIDWVDVSAGENHTCAIRKDTADDASDPDIDTLWCWGSNAFKQLGTPLVSGDEASPQLITIGTATPSWLKVSAGDRHTCAIQSDNTLWCWGDNAYGQLGQGDTTTQASPTQVGSDSDWIDVSASGPHTCALKEGGDLWCWGNNLYGQLGLAEVGHQPSPGKVLSESKFTQVVTGEFHTCALDDDNESHCWGFNAQGQLGIAAIPDFVSAAQYNRASWKQVSSGEEYSCGIKSDDTLWCGGINGLGQLGDKTPINRAAAVQVESDIDSWLKVEVGNDHACAITATDNSLWCWGSNDRQQLGTDSDTGNNFSNWIPEEVSFGGAWRDVSAGLNHTCALRQEAGGVSAWCWGDNSFGQTTSASPNPDFNASRITNATGPEADWIAIAAGGGHSCGIRETSILPLRRELYCWGRNNVGQLGQDIATTPTSAVPLRVGNDTDWVDVSAGNNHTCGIRQPSTSPLERIVICWGENNSKQTPALDDPLTQTKATLRQVEDKTDWLAIEAGFNNTCGLRRNSATSSSLFCWGDNSTSQIRNRTPQVNTVPIPVSKGEKEWGSFSPGRYHTCGIATEEGEQNLLCWGQAAPYQLGNGNAWQFTPQRLLF